jgi:hypothetical protein
MEPQSAGDCLAGELYNRHANDLLLKNAGQSELFWYLLQIAGFNLNVQNDRQSSK